MKTKIITIVALLIVVLGLTVPASAAETTLVVDASWDKTFTASMQALNEMGLNVKNSDRESGIISAENKVWSGEANQFLNVTITRVSKEQTEVTVEVKKRRLSFSGGNTEKRLMEFRDALSKRLGKNVSITVIKNDR